jgi:hypothetical protein
VLVKDTFTAEYEYVVTYAKLVVLAPDTVTVVFEIFNRVLFASEFTVVLPIDNKLEVNKLFEVLLPMDSELEVNRLVYVLVYVLVLLV